MQTVKRSPPEPAIESLLATSQITKTYGQVTVLDQVDFDVRAGEIHALLGANGAGKSTLCKIISGLIQPSGGTMLLRGQRFQPRGKLAAEKEGVGIVQQELNLIPTLTVAENLQLSHLPSRFGVIRRKQLHELSDRVLQQFGLQEVASETPLSELGVGRQQMVEIARALAQDCDLLILDEPTAALSQTESERLFTWLKELRDRGVGIIYISHRLAEVKQLTDRITVLRDGQLVTTCDTAQLSTDAMIDLMSGHTTATGQGQTKDHTSLIQDSIGLSVSALSCGMVQDVSFEVRRGERLGIAGLVGSGRTELLRAIFGADVASRGSVQVLPGSPTRFRSPSEAVRAGLALVTEDRKQNGLLLPQSIQLNATLAALHDRYSAAGILRQAAARGEAIEQCERLDCRYENIDQSVATLSGGNQQKVAVARWLLRDASVFLFDEPTRGIDVAARQRIYQLMESLAREGKSMVIASSDLDELLSNCDRIAVLSAGQLTAVFSREDFDEEQIAKAAFSSYVPH